jgi:hypothetical protein
VLHAGLIPVSLEGFFLLSIEVICRPAYSTVVPQGRARREGHVDAGRNGNGITEGQ